MKSPKLIVGLIVFVLFLVFLFQNMEVVTLRLYFWKISMPQIILLPLCIIIGFAVGFFTAKVNRKDRTPKKIKA